MGHNIRMDIGPEKKLDKNKRNMNKVCFLLIIGYQYWFIIHGNYTTNIFFHVIIYLRLESTRGGKRTT